MKKLMPLAALALLSSLAAAPAVLAQASAAQAAGKTKPSPLAPSEIVAAAPKGDWTAIPASDLLVMELAPDAKGRPRRVVIQLMPPPFSQGWIGNIRKLAAAHWWDGMSVNRVQDNYVVQWGDPNADDKAKAKALPAGLLVVPETAYGTAYEPTMFETKWSYGRRPATEAMVQEPAPPGPPAKFGDAYLDRYSFSAGFPVGYSEKQTSKPDKRFDPKLNYFVTSTSPDKVWPVHCYGMVGVGRDLSPNTGSGAELYVVIGHAPRHLDRNIALVGRVIEGMEYLSSLPRGHGALGFVDPAQGDEPVPIQSIHPGIEVKDLPAFEYLSTESASFAKYADARANRRDAFFIRPAGGADVCNIPVPVRRVKD